MVRQLFLLLLLSLALVACNRNPLEVVISRCPAVAVVGDSGVFTKFDGSSENVDDIVYTATIQNIDISCQEGDDVRAAVSFDISAIKGPSGKGSTVTLPYFIAVLKDNNEIVSKQSFSVTYPFDGDGVASGKEIISHYIPTIAQARRYNYEILVGFELDAADYWFNIRR